MPTLVGARRRGFTPEGFRLFAERIGVSKSDSWIDMSVLEDCMRDDLNARAPRRIAVLDPVKLVIDNYPEGQEEDCFAPEPSAAARARTSARCRSRASCGSSATTISEDAAEGLFPPRAGRRGAPALRATSCSCIGAEKDAARQRDASSIAPTIPPRAAERRAPTRARSRATSTGCRPRTRVPAEVRLYDRLFAVPFPGARNPRGSARRRRGGRAVAARHASSPATTTTTTSEPVERN